MNNYSKPSDDFINYLIECEGLKFKAYLDTGSIPTIGIGTAIDTKEEEYLLTKTITKQEAIDLALKDLKECINFVKKVVKQQLTENQFFALVDFCYNAGIGSFQKSTLLKLVNLNPNNHLIEQEFMKWIYVNGKKINGLVNRCTKRSALYFKGINKTL